MVTFPCSAAFVITGVGVSEKGSLLPWKCSSHIGCLERDYDPGHDPAVWWYSVVVVLTGIGIAVIAQLRWLKSRGG